MMTSCLLRAEHNRVFFLYFLTDTLDNRSVPPIFGPPKKQLSLYQKYVQGFLYEKRVSLLHAKSVEILSLRNARIFRFYFTFIKLDMQDGKDFSLLVSRIQYSSVVICSVSYPTHCYTRDFDIDIEAFSELGLSAICFAATP